MWCCHRSYIVVVVVAVASVNPLWYSIALREFLFFPIEQFDFGAVTMQKLSKCYKNCAAPYERQTHCAMCVQARPNGRSIESKHWAGMRFTISYHFHFSEWVCVCAYDIWLQLCNFIARICLMMWTMQFPSQKICNNSLSQCHHSHCRCRHRRSSRRRAFPNIIWKMVKFFPSQILYWYCSRRGTRLKIYILNAQYIACTLHFNDNLITLFVMLMSISITQSRWWWWCITSNVKCLRKNDDDKNFNFQSVYKNAIAQKKSNWQPKIDLDFEKMHTHRTRKITRIDFFRFVSSPLFVELILLFGVWIEQRSARAGLKKEMKREMRAHATKSGRWCFFALCVCLCDVRSLLILLGVFTTLSSLVLFIHTQRCTFKRL